MSDEAHRDLVAFEAEADLRMQALSLWGLPYRSIYSAALLAADNAFSGGRFGNNHRAPEPDKGGTMLARLSYWRPYLQRCTRDIGADLANALGLLSAQAYQEIADALLYSHFCELMPFVHRKTFVVERTAMGFYLSYPNEAAARYEALDVVSSELALTALVGQFRYEPVPLLKMVETWPRVDTGSFNTMLRQAYNFHLQNVREDAFIGADVYERVLGFRHDEFIRVRAAVMAYASWCLGMANAAEAHSYGAKGEKQAHFRNECLEWLVPLLRRDMVYGTIQQLADVSAEEINAILGYFEDDPFCAGGVSGEGYLAPFNTYDGSVLISPRAMHLMMPERNILYVLNKRDRTRFDDLVSAELEPSLLVHARSLLDRLPGVETRANVHWRNGEIDLLAFCRGTNTALQIQAKAAIPPAGARMTRQAETNTHAAVRQLAVFERLLAVEKDAVVQSAFGGGALDVRWGSCVLSRSSFGTASAWEAIGDRAAMNLTLMKLVVSQLEAESAVDLTTVPGRAAQALRDIADEGIQAWVEEPLNVFGTIIVVPLLRLNNRAIARRRAAILG